MNGRALVGYAALLGLACTGTIGTRPSGGTGATLAPPGAPAMPVDPMDVSAAQTCKPAIASAPLRRLSYAEYQATLKDLLGGLNLPPPDILRDPTSNGFENQAPLLNPSAQLVEQYGTAAINAGLKAATTLTALVPCTPKTAADEKTCGAQFVEQFGAQVFRRPLTADEKADYQAYFESERALADFKGAVQLTVEVMLQSPQFLYRLELGDPATAASDRIKLTPYEVATRMSYLLWGSAPDAKLLAKAQAGALDAPVDREAEARRLLSDPHAQAMFVEFHRQWLDLDAPAREPKDAMTYPSYTPDLAAAIREESDRFVGSVMGAGGDGSFRTLLTSSKTQVNAPLAKLYGVAPPAAGWGDVTLDAGQRAGILTRADFLAGRAHMVAGSPPLRANYVLQRFLCQTAPPPPANADLSEPAAKATAGAVKTNRQLFEDRVAPATCHGCHSLFNPLGYALESYDGIGQYRTTDHGLPVDASAHFQMGTIDWQLANGVDLSAKLAASSEVQTCVATHWFEYALGRDIETADQCRMAKSNLALTTAGGDVRELLVSLVTSPEFVYRPPVVQ